MKRLNKFCIGLLLISCSACNSWLDIDQMNLVQEERLFTSEQGFREALAGVYSKMSKQNMYGENMTFGFMDVLGQGYNYTTMSESFQYLKNYDYKEKSSVAYLYSLWRSNYSAIASANNILKWLDKNGSILNGSARNQIRGEALTLRAYLHFDLLRMFAPDVIRKGDVIQIPYNKEFGVKAPGFVSGKTFVQSVLDDLEKALALLVADPILSVVPYEMGNAAKDSGDPLNENKDGADQYVARINYFAVKALMARVNLYKGDLVSARTLADEVISSGKFKLVDKAKSINVAAAEQDVLFSDEHIFSLRSVKIVDYSKTLHKTGNAQGNVALAARKDVSGLYDGLYEDIRLATWYNDGILEKFLKENRTRFTPKIPMIRLAEMYLIAAEGWLETDPGLALERLNTLRVSRSNASSKLEKITSLEIQHEMRREFIGEGQLFFMYKRLNIDIPRESGLEDVRANDVVFVLPLPEEETENAYRSK